MTFALASPIDYRQFSDPASYRAIFDEQERKKLAGEFDPRELPPICSPGESCKSNLFLGFFFDGTRNNYAVSEQAGDFTHSNVARLFDAYPGQTIAPAVMLTPQVKWPEEARYPNYFRVYTPGVGTRFEEVGDMGKGIHRTFGSAAALLGERRLTWALAQAINAVHRYFLKKPLLSNADIMELARKADLNALALKGPPVFIDFRPGNAKALWKQVLWQLHDALRPYMPDPITLRPQVTDPGVIKAIYVSVFGFSRGAAAARVFTNWFLALCDLDAAILKRSGRTLGGFPVTFDFLGVFDTVASVGTAATAPMFDGHEAWADAEVSLRVPAGVKCTHLVSCHEVRRSFPLDSISVGGMLPDGCKEIVFPGVHSDVGGGYAPCEQGRGSDKKGADLLSRITLAVMYREARLNGVPLKLERCRPFVKERFLVDPSVINALNAYLEASPKSSKNDKDNVPPSLRDIMRSQMQMAILWRKRWAGQMKRLPSTERSKQEDINDLVGADSEFVEEIRQFDSWRKQVADPKPCPNIAVCVEQEKIDVPGVDYGRFIEWGDIGMFWNESAPTDAIAYLLENYVHDSRAWFKLDPREWEAGEVEAGLKDWARRYDRVLRQGSRQRWNTPNLLLY